MAMKNIELMSKAKFVSIIIFVIILQVSFFIIPAYWNQDFTDLIKFNGCTIGKIQESTMPNCNETKWVPASDTEMPRHGFVFELPRIEWGLRHDYTKWRSKLIGYLSITTRKKVINSVFKEWKVNLLVHQGANSSATTYDNSTITMARYNSSDIDRQDSYSYYTIPLLDFIPLPDTEYIVIVHSPLLETHGPEVYGMTMTLSINGATFTEFMVYSKIVFFVMVIVLFIWYMIQRCRGPKDDFWFTDMVVWQSTGSVILVDMPLEWIDLHLDYGLLHWKDFWTDYYYFTFQCFCLFFTYFNCIIELDSSKLQKKTSLIISYLAIIIGIFIFTWFHAHQNHMEVTHPLFNLGLTDWHEILVLSLMFLLPVIAVINMLCLMNLLRRAGLLEATLSSRDDPTVAEFIPQRPHERSLYVLFAIFICALFTTLEFVCYELIRYQIKWRDVHSLLHYPAAFSIGVFSMWNIFTLMIVYFYTPVRSCSFTSPPPSYEECTITTSPYESTAVYKVSQKINKS